MEILRTYIDTSVLGGYFDREFEKDTGAFVRHIRNGKVMPVVSDMVAAEIARAPERVRDLLQVLLRGGAEIAKVTEEAVTLQEAYMRGGVLGQGWEEDAMHVAMATLARVDVIVSWNFRHFVNPRRVRAFNGVNVSMGYGLISILSPSDVVHLLEAKP